MDKKPQQQPQRPSQANPKRQPQKPGQSSTKNPAQKKEQFQFYTGLQLKFHISTRVRYIGCIDIKPQFNCDFQLSTQLPKSETAWKTMLNLFLL